MRTVLPLGLIVALSTSSSLSAGGNEDASIKQPFASPRHSGEGRVAFSSSDVHLLGWRVLADLPGGSNSANDCWGYTSPSGREYAILGLEKGTAFVEVTDPGNPVTVGYVPGVQSLWRCVKVYGDYAYAGSEGGGGIQVFDLTSIDAGSVTLQATVTTGGCTTQTHTLAVDTTSGFLYRAGGGGTPCFGGSEPQGLTIYSLANPALPAFVASWNNRYVHECQVETWDVAGPHFGKQIAFCFTELGSGGGSPRLTILDVTNKGAIVQLASIFYAGNAFAHQGWTSADKTRLYLNDEHDDDTFGGARTRIFDIGNLAAPTYIGFFYAGAPSIDHNLYVKENRIFEGNYRSGLRVFDNTVLDSPTLIGFFDTYPPDDAQQYNSLWSNYPYFDSGTVIGGDIEKGLFVWRIGTPKITFEFPDGTPERIGPPASRVRFDAVPEVPGGLDEQSVRFHVALNGGAFTELVPEWLGGNRYEATLPAASCGDSIDYYVRATTTDDLSTWSDPPGAPTQVHQAIAAYEVTVDHSDDLEADAGWLVDQAADIPGGDVADTGSWSRVNPVGTSAQPEDDHSSAGTSCFVTGQGVVGGALGDADVDLGYTALRSPVLDTSGMSDPYLSYWRWFSNNNNLTVPDDTLTVHVSNDGGASWTLVETLGPLDLDSLGGWIRHEFRIASLVAPTNDMRLRFRTSDSGTGSIVEAAIDDLQIVDYACAALTASGITPATGPFRGGNVVTITGTNFSAGNTTVRFGFRDAVVNVLDSTTLEATVPPAPSSSFDKFRPAAVTVDVTVQKPGVDVLPAAYTYQPPPQKSL